ncbi:unnamed protein product [Lampetra planeri]
MPKAGSAAEASSPRQVEDGQRRMEEQLESLRTVLLQLVLLVASSTSSGHPQEVLPRGNVQRLETGASEGRPAKTTTAIAGAGKASAITCATETTRQDAAILSGAAEMRSEPAISSEPHGTLAAGADAPAGRQGAEHTRRLPHVKEFVAAGGDWSDVTWRFETAFWSVQWSEEEVLVALPTILDDDALAVFRSIPPEKKKTLKSVYAEMADVYEPPSDTRRKFMQRRRGSSESPLAYLVILVASYAVTGRSQDVSPKGDEQRPLQGILEGPPLESTAAIAVVGRLSTITAAVDATRQEAAILGVAVEVRSDLAISVEPCGEPPCGAATAECGGGGRNHRRPHIKEFVTAGGDWSAFTWRFESAFRSVWWTGVEALGVLPTVLDDQALAVFRSIPPGKKKTLKDVYAVIAEVYEPPSDTQWKLMHRRRGSNESSLAYRGALLALAMAAYHDAKLEILILGKMLELAKDMGVKLPVCGHEPLTFRWAAKCLNAQDNLQHWAQMAAWNGVPGS